MAFATTSEEGYGEDINHLKQHPLLQSGVFVVASYQMNAAIWNKHNYSTKRDYNLCNMSHGIYPPYELYTVHQHGSNYSI